MKIKQLAILFILLLLVACSRGEKPKEHLGEIYSIALDVLMETDQALNSEMKFIAIDMSNMTDLNQQDKDEIMDYFKEKYKVEVMDATLEELKEKGYYDTEMLALEGVLLEFEKVDYKFTNKVDFEGSKFRSGKGAIGVQITVFFKEGKWQIKEANEIWVS